MCLLLGAVTGNCTKKSIETNSMGALGNSLIPILPGFRCCGLTAIQISQLEMK